MIGNNLPNQPNVGTLLCPLPDGETELEISRSGIDLWLPQD
jgi:hypothetical protein